MALKFADGFDHYAIGDIAEWWSAQSGAAFGTGRTGNSVDLAGSADFVSKTLPSSHASGCCGFAWKATVVTGVMGDFFLIRAGSTDHLNLILNASQQIEVRRNTTVIATGTTVLSANTWYYIEVKWTIDDTTGSVEVRLNGSGSAECSFSGDTRNAATADWNTIRLERTAGTGTTSFDDLYLLDGSAGASNFLGDCAVTTLIASAGNGTNTGFTPSTGVDHGEMVNDTTPNDDTDYNSGTAAAQKDTYNLPNLSFTPATIFGVLPFVNAKKTDAGARSLCTVIRSGGADTDGSSQALSTSYLYYHGVHETDPATGVAWVKAGVDALETGAKVTV